MLTTYEQHSKRKLAATVLSMIVIAGVVVLADHFKSTGSTLASKVAQTTSSMTPPSSDSMTATPSTGDQSSSSTNSSSSSNSSSSFKDGTYTASSDYYVPHGDESIQVSLTLSNGTIASASIKNSEGDRTSAAFQEDFAASYKQYVVGKNISSLRLGVIAGASDTTQGFADALSQIASKAQA